MIVRKMLAYENACACLSVCLSVCMYVCIYMYAFIYVCMCVSIYACMCVRASVFMYIRMSVTFFLTSDLLHLNSNTYVARSIGVHANACTPIFEVRSKT